FRAAILFALALIAPSERKRPGLIITSKMAVNFMVGETTRTAMMWSCGRVSAPTTADKRHPAYLTTTSQIGDSRCAARTSWTLARATCHNAPARARHDRI